MSVFDLVEAPTQTSWGCPDNAEQPIPGVWRVRTPSHGGYVLSDQRQAAMPASLRLRTREYEEDADWSLVALAFEAELLAANADHARTALLAHEIAQNWHPDRYAAFTGTPLAEADSLTLRRRAAYLAAVGEVVVVSASGDWADWVPAGKVGVIGRRLAGLDDRGWPRFDGPSIRALVDKPRYDSSRIVNALRDLGAEPL